MIRKLLIVDVNVSDDVKSLLKILKGDDVIITYYNYSKGFIVNHENLLVNKILALTRSHLETSLINLEHLCFLNFEQMKTPQNSSKYNNERHQVSGIENEQEHIESWNFMEQLTSDITKATTIHNIDFVDIDQLCFPKEHEVIFNQIQVMTSNIEGQNINYLKVNDNDKDAIYDSENWLHTMFTTFYEGDNKILLDKYFKVNNTTIGYLGTKTLKPRNLRIFESHKPSIDFEGGELNVCIIPLYGYSGDLEYDSMAGFIEFLNHSTIVEFIYPTDTMDDFLSRFKKTIDRYCKTNKNKISILNACLWLNPNVRNPLLSLSDNINANIDEGFVQVINELMLNNTENIDILQNHFIVRLNETLIDYFSMNVFESQKSRIINFEF